MTDAPPLADVGIPTDVDSASVGLVTIDTISEAITSCNDAFIGLVDRGLSEVLGCLVTDFIGDKVQPLATAVIEGIRSGYISSVGGNVEVAGQAGSVRIDCWILALGSDGPHTTAIAGVVPTQSAASPETTEPADSGFRPTHVDPNRIVLATLDDDWRIVEMAPGTAGQLGLPVPTATTVMPRLHELVAPADAPVLEGALGRRSSKGTSDTSETLTLRLRAGDDRWQSARVTLSPLRGEVRARFGLVAWLMPAGEQGDGESERVARLEDQLHRIRQVLQTSVGQGASGSVDLSDLTMRQREIVEQLLEGHRVDAIARDLYVSPSTVRNHLSAIFEKFGVTSQSELVELLRGHSANGPGTV